MPTIPDVPLGAPTPLLTDEALTALDGERPLIVLGNCQAEAVRLMVSGEASGTASTQVPPSVRLPPVFELTAADLPALRRLLARAAALVMQPVRENYRGLPIGTAQLEALLPADAVAVRVPVLRDTALFPWQAIVRGPRHEAADPPVVPYHDLRTLSEAAARLRGTPAPEAVRAPGPGAAPRLPLDAETIRALAEDSLAQLRMREQAHATVPVSTWLREIPGRGFHTINHPSISVLTRVAEEVRTALGVSEPVPAPSPQRPMLAGLDTPVEEQVVDALGIDVVPHAAWRVRGVEVPDVEVRAAHLAWYASRADVVDGGLRRHAARIEALGLGR